MKKQYCKDYTRTWLRLIDADSDQLVILCPYITYIPEFIRKCARCTLYTRFDLWDFVIGASSLRCIRKLLELKFDVFKVTDLHAKIVMVRNKFVSIGSQNLTRGGQRHKEATVLLTDEAEVRRLWKETREWRETAVEINFHTLDLLEAEVKRLRKDFKIPKLENDTDSIYMELSNLFEPGEQIQSQERIKSMIDDVERLPIAKDYPDKHRGKVEFDNLEKLTVRIYPPFNQKIGTYHRYLVFNARKGWFGWGRICKTRVSFVSKDVNRNDGLAIRCEFTWTSLARDEPNVVVDGKNAIFRTKRPYLILEDSESAQNQKRQLNLRKYREAILSPFKFETALRGGERNIDKFFGNEDEEFEISVRACGKYPVFVFSKSHTLGQTVSNTRTKFSEE